MVVCLVPPSSTVRVANVSSRFAQCWSPAPVEAPVETEKFEQAEAHLVNLKLLTCNVLSLVDDLSFDQTGRRGCIAQGYRKPAQKLELPTRITTRSAVQELQR